MSPFGEGASELEQKPPPDWSVVSDPADAPSRPVVIAAHNAAAGAVGIALLWLLGHHTPALVLLGMLVVATATSLVFPAVAAKLELATRAIQRVAGRVLTLVLLTVLELLVFTPVWLFLRLVRHDPLALGCAPGASSFWRPATAHTGRPLYRRQFAYERRDGHQDGRGRRPLAVVCDVLGVIALLALLDVGVGALLHTGDANGASASGARQSLLVNPNAPAGHDAPWLKTLAAEIDRVWYGNRYDPYLGWTMPNYHGTYLNTSGGVRQSYEPASSLAPRAVRVFFFGGSTMFGMYQRDQYTIPSDVARLAEVDGIPLRVFNYGQLAYNNWQELLLLEQLVSRGQTPDLAVFYDGANELVSQFQYGPHPQPTHLEAGEFARRIGLAADGGRASQSGGSPLAQLYRSWSNVSAMVWLSRHLRGVPAGTSSTGQTLVSPWAGNQQAEAVQSGRDAAVVLSRGVTVARRFASASKFDTVFFLQPFIYSKPPVAGEQQEVGSLGTDPIAWRRAYARLRSTLGRTVVDVTGALDSVKTPIMYDFVHTNELGAAAVARALYARLRPTLRSLHRGRRP
jgi:hypothetical protein